MSPHVHVWGCGWVAPQQSNVACHIKWLRPGHCANINLSVGTRESYLVTLRVGLQGERMPSRVGVVCALERCDVDFLAGRTPGQPTRCLGCFCPGPGAQPQAAGAPTCTVPDWHRGTLQFVTQTVATPTFNIMTWFGLFGPEVSSVLVFWIVVSLRSEVA